MKLHIQRLYQLITPTLKALINAQMNVKVVKKLNYHSNLRDFPEAAAWRKFEGNSKGVWREYGGNLGEMRKSMSLD